MKVLWIVNIILPEAQALLSGNDSDIKATGGWMVALSKTLSEVDGVELYISSLCTTVKKLTKLNGERITYYLIPCGKGPLPYNKDYESYWKEINNSIKPDVVHIHGTEQSQGLAYVRACGNQNVVASIQGLTSIYARFHHTGIGIKDIICNWTIRDTLQGCTLRKEQKELQKSGMLEIELLKNLKHVIGRTSWDRIHTWAVNPYLTYHFGNETLRQEFYDGKWSYEKCNKHSIFLSQAATPIKGLYFFLRALEIVAVHYPDVRVHIAGYNITNPKSFREKILYRGYAKLLNRFLQKGILKNRISFMGPLDASEMKREYLCSNVFVCPSTIENSPNSLGEAQLLGVPCIASYVGGTMDMIPDDLCGRLYRYEEYEMLAYFICKTFESSSTFDNTHMMDVARRRHDAKTNVDALVNIYKEISGL